MEDDSHAAGHARPRSSSNASSDRIHQRPRLQDPSASPNIARSDDEKQIDLMKRAIQAFSEMPHGAMFAMDIVQKATILNYDVTMLLGLPLSEEKVDFLSHFAHFTSTSNLIDTDWLLSKALPKRPRIDGLDPDSESDEESDEEKPKDTPENTLVPTKEELEETLKVANTRAKVASKERKKLLLRIKAHVASGPTEKENDRLTLLNDLFCAQWVFAHNVARVAQAIHRNYDREMFATYGRVSYMLHH